MPLIIITGLPSSGKTHRARQILSEFEARISNTSAGLSSHLPNNVTVQHLNSSHASADHTRLEYQGVNQSISPTNPRDLVYNSAREEKTARAEEFSAAKRALSKNNVVILDAPNYIKGFRYQLWCEAKAVGTRSVVVHAAAREDECESWNADRIRAWGWENFLTTDAENGRTSKGAKVGSDVKGHLQPESHTAIYGDKLVDEVPRTGLRSRSSSMGDNTDDEDEPSTKRETTEIMTLKSLYISDNQPDTEEDNHTLTNKNTMKLGNPRLPEATYHASMVSGLSNIPSPGDSLPYSPATLQSLAMRYEPPSPFTRWDTPLFTVPPTDTHPPYQAIWDALFPPPTKSNKKATAQSQAGETIETKAEEVRRHAATVLPKATGPEALQTLESATADVVKTLLAAARECGTADGEGGSLTFSIPDPKSGNDIGIQVDVPLNTILSQPSLQRIRRKYTQIQRGGIAHGQGYVSGRREIVKDFCGFLETEWNRD